MRVVIVIFAILSVCTFAPVAHAVDYDVMHGPPMPAPQSQNQHLPFTPIINRNWNKLAAPDNSFSFSLPCEKSKIQSKIENGDMFSKCDPSFGYSLVVMTRSVKKNSPKNIDIFNFLYDQDASDKSVSDISTFAVGGHRAYIAQTVRQGISTQYEVVELEKGRLIWLSYQRVMAVINLSRSKTALDAEASEKAANNAIAQKLFTSLQMAQ